MGDWNTLHLFDDKLFFNETVPTLKGLKGDLTPYYNKYITTCINQQCDLSLEGIIQFSNQLENNFSTFPPFQGMSNDGSPNAFQQLDPRAYHFTHFFEQIVFTECADLFPYYILGKHGIAHIFPEIPLRGAAERIIWHLGIGTTFFCYDGFGISSWISGEEVKFLFDAIEDFLSKDIKISEDDLMEVVDFRNLLKVALTLNVSLLSGLNLDTRVLKTLPQRKLSNNQIWKDAEIGRLTFE